jgi:penicillin-binding protein 1A
MNNSSTYREERMASYEHIIKWMWRLTIGGMGVVILLFIILNFTGLPSFEELENPKSRDASEIYSSDNKVLGRYFIENRVRIRYEDLSPHLVNALIATEDERFHEHSGIDVEALMRVGVKTVIFRQSAGGGSTITQQLAKLLFTGQASRNVVIRAIQKLKEWVVAVKLERSYTKEEILTMYLNEFDFLYNANGIKSASETYFGKSPDSLEIEEAALLIGMLKNPALYNPRKFPENAKKRREVVLFQMKNAGHINQAEYDEYRQRPMDMTKFKRIDHNEGLAPYFREQLRLELKNLLGDKRKSNGEPYDLYRDGLKIYTTIDSRMQKHAEMAVEEHMKSFQPKFFNEWSRGAKDPWTYQVENQPEKLKVRQDAFENLVRSSDRYELRRGQILKKASEFELRDIDIERMFMIEKKGWDIMYEWLNDDFISKKLARNYEKIMQENRDGEDWMTIKREWTEFQKIIKKEFSTKTEMRVFAYNTEGEKDTVLTPYDSIRYHRMFLQVGMMAVDPLTGHVKAWVGGVNHKYFKYDHVNKSANRQVGSTFKPFLYALAMQRDYTPCDKLPDVRTTIEAGTFGLTQSWTPHNSDNKYLGYNITLVEALNKSKNTISVALMRDIRTTEPLRELVSKMGVEKSKIQQSPSICLGVSDLSVFEMVGAYTAFANEGIYTEPTYIQRVVDKYGNTVYEADINQTQVLEEKVYYSMIHLMRGVVKDATGFGNLKSDIGGKTGTTSNYSDGWFMGITPNIVIGTWVGGDDRWVRFKSIGNGQGARMARPIFAKFLQKIESDTDLAFDSTTRFKKPDTYDIELNCSLYQEFIPDGVEFDSEYDINSVGDTTSDSGFSEEY